MTDLHHLQQHITHCRLCPRLVAWREQIARQKRKAYQHCNYWGRPVAGFGDPNARILVVGLAPGAHGSNRTGRMFTGDASGDFLYPALHRAGFANQPHSRAPDDGLTLTDLFITAAARCAPPNNKPTPQELNTCQPYLAQEIALLRPKVIVCLGQIAFERVLRTLNQPRQGKKFGHGVVYQIPDGPTLLCSYHPSQQNTLTGKLTAPMFDEIWQTARRLLQQ